MISSPCIADIDSIASFLRQAEQKVKILDYTEASEFYLKALLLNPNDKAVQARRLDVENMYTMDCNRYSGIAESYFNDGDYEKAVELNEISLGQKKTIPASLSLPENTLIPDGISR